MAIDAEHGRLFIGCHNNKLIVMDTKDGKVLADLPIGKGNDACGFDPGTGEAFASCGDGTLTVVKETSPGKFEVVQTVKTPRMARRWRSTRRPTRCTCRRPSSAPPSPASVARLPSPARS